MKTLLIAFTILNIATISYAGMDFSGRSSEYAQRELHRKRLAMQQYYDDYVRYIEGIKKSGEYDAAELSRMYDKKQMIEANLRKLILADSFGAVVWCVSEPVRGLNE